MSINAYIGPAEFYAVTQWQLSPPQHGYLNIDDDWEFGSGYAELGKKGLRGDQLTCLADCLSPFDRKELLAFYAEIKRFAVDIHINVGGTFISYLDYKVLLVEDITDHPFSPVVSGGMSGGLFDVATRWTVQQITGDW